MAAQEFATTKRRYPTRSSTLLNNNARRVSLVERRETCVESSMESSKRQRMNRMLTSQLTIANTGPVQVMLTVKERAISKATTKNSKCMTGLWAVDNRIGIDEPFCAAAPAKYRCRLKGTCEECFASSVPCSHFVESRLHLLLVGHNPAVSCCVQNPFLKYTNH
jgi:hypothetical protein